MRVILLLSVCISADAQLNFSLSDRLWKSASPLFESASDETLALRKLNKGLPSVAPGCRVGKRGLLTRMNDMSELHKATSVNLNLTAWALQMSPFNSTDDQASKVFMLWSLQTPIKTSPQLSTCFFPTFLPGSNATRLSLCAETPRERDRWLEALTEAVFCLHSGRYKPMLALDQGETIEVPKRSTKDERWKEQIGKGVADVETEVTQTDKPNISLSETEPVAAQIEIVNIGSGDPTTMVDGQPIPEGED